ncbi:MAG: dATP/dGTP diphosphohydrolase domain-containing protein [Gemmataceae bacterium]
MQDYELQDSGRRQEFATGAVRDQQTGKGRFDLLPAKAMARLAKHFEKGATKYQPRNWERGIPVSRFLDSALRHAFSYIGGEKGEDHLVAAAWNLIAALETESRALEGQLPAELVDIGSQMQREEVSE